MALLYPEFAEAHADWAQYQFQYGPSLLAAPIYSWGKQRLIWFPPGEWIDTDTGDAFIGPQVTRVPAPIEKLPLFARSGAVIPMQLDRASDVVTLRLYAGAEPEASTLTLRDGTRIAFTPDEGGGVVTVNGPSAAYRLETPFLEVATNSVGTPTTSNADQTTWSLRWR